MSSSLPKDFAALELAIIDAANLHEKEGSRVVGYRRFFPLGDYVVKFNDHARLLPEYLTLKYLFELAAKDGDAAPRVPEVHHFFYQQGRFAYMVMECIELAEVPPQELAAKAAEAVLWMLGKGAPSTVVLGPLGSAYARHVVFKERVAPRKFTSVEALERFLNTGVENIRLRSRIKDIRIAGEELVLTQSDINPGNFGVDTNGRPVIFDAATIGWLPESFANYTLLLTNEFATAVSKHVFAPEKAEALKRSANLVSMSRVRALLIQVYRDDL
ncbi:hypothetical protein FRC01_010491, partial [Tulasnella sp. 417]